MWRASGLGQAQPSRVRACEAEDFARCLPPRLSQPLPTALIFPRTGRSILAKPARARVRVVRAHYACPRGSRLCGYDARAIDAHTVEIPLKIPFAPDFLPTLASDFCKIIPKHWAESGIDVQKWENAMGSGPFKPGKFVKDV